MSLEIGSEVSEFHSVSLEISSEVLEFHSVSLEIGSEVSDFHSVMLKMGSVNTGNINKVLVCHSEHSEKIFIKL